MTNIDISHLNYRLDIMRDIHEKHFKSNSFGNKQNNLKRGITPKIQTPQRFIGSHFLEPHLNPNYSNDSTTKKYISRLCNKCSVGKGK